MRLPVTIARTAPRGSGLAPAQNIGALTRSSDQALYSGLGAFGRGLNVAADYAFRDTLERHNIDAKMQHAKMTSGYEGFVQELERSFDTAQITTNKQRQELFTQTVKNVDNYYRERLKEVDNPDAKELIRLSWQDDRQAYKKRIWSKLSGNLDQYQRNSGLKYGQSLIREGRTEEADEYFNDLIRNRLYTQEEVDFAKSYTTLDTKAKNMLAMGKNIGAIEKYIMSQSVDTSIKRKIVSDINFEGMDNQRRRREQLEQKDSEYYQLFREGNYRELSDSIERDLTSGKIPADLAKEYDAMLAKIVTGEKVETKQLTKGALETEAYRIEDSGRVQPLRDKLRKAFINGDIDKKDYDEIYSLTERKFDAHRDAEVAERMKDAAKQLLTIPDKDSQAYQILVEGKKPDEILTINRHRQLESDNLDRYRRALRQWLADNPEATAVDIYKYGRELRALYKKSPEQLEQEEIERIEDAKQQEKEWNEFIKKQRAKTESLKKQIESQSRAVPKTPQGRVMVEKDGKKFTVPAEQLEEAKKQGYKEVK